MKEIREILGAVSTLAPSEKAVLATVIDVRGSGYRLPGARMLMLSTGETFGIVSGGCLEADVLERAKKVLATGRAEVFTYDTTVDENSVFSMNMGCRGVVRILLEAVQSDSPLVGKLRRVVAERSQQTMATLVSTTPPINGWVGRRTFLDDIINAGTGELPPLLAALQPVIEQFSSSGLASDFVTISAEDYSFEFALETCQPPLSILIFGAGADALPLARIAADLGWEVTIYDHRPAFLRELRFTSAPKLILLNADEPLESFPADNRTAAVVMTHNYDRDRLILPALLRSDVIYIGALGPKRRTEELLREITASGQKFEDHQRKRLFAPAGLDIGADTPEGIALSIIGEIESVQKKRGGGNLRDRNGSIYDRK